MKLTAIIPARYKSSRFPGKPLAKINGIEMIKIVYTRCYEYLTPLGIDIFVATDDSRIMNFCKKNNLKSIMTSQKNITGTDRIIEVSKKIESDVFLNIQGDEPLVNKKDLFKIINEVKENGYKYDVFAGYSKIIDSEDFYSSKIPKMVFNDEKELIYTSRAPIPGNKTMSFQNSFRQICIYSFSKAILNKIPLNNKKTLEEIEDLELLRFLENDIKVKMVEMSSDSLSVDFPEDIKKVEKILNNERN